LCVLRLRICGELGGEPRGAQRTPARLWQPYIKTAQAPYPEPKGRGMFAKGFDHLPADPAGSRRAGRLADDGQHGAVCRLGAAAAVPAGLGVPSGVDDPVPADGLGELSDLEVGRVADGEKAGAGAVRRAAGGQFRVAAAVLPGGAVRV